MSVPFLKSLKSPPFFAAGISLGLCATALAKVPAAEPGSKEGAITEQTPSVPHYFSWINNTNEGPTEEQTLINLRFFKWLHDEYGMQLGIYAFDAGAIDTKRYYGSMETERFRNRFPNGFDKVAALAKSFDCRLGIWGGPDGFGDTPEEERARTELLVSLCRDYGFRLFKFDAVCGQLRDEKQAAFAAAMSSCREHAPDLIVLNHRLNLDRASRRHVTTFLWGGQETYIDVGMLNTTTATHNRQGALARGLPPNLMRLTEDHGVCISSCLDFWEDELVLQGFNRSLILAPQVYGNPWLLKDDEFAKLTRIHNLHYRNRETLVHGMVLPESYGPHAVSRGDQATRFVTLRNLTWNPVNYTVKLDAEIGLEAKGRVELRRYHPGEEILGSFDHGKSFEVTVDPFRSCLLMATVGPCPEIGLEGCTYEVVRDTPGKSAKVKLLGMPGSTATVRLRTGARTFTRAIIDGKAAPGLLGAGLGVTFPGEPFEGPWHGKLADLEPVPVPDDAARLYESACFTAPNDALEVQSLRRSGPSRIPQVIAARKAFFEQELFWRRGIWHRYLFDNRDETFFGVQGGRNLAHPPDRRLRGGCLRVDLGEARPADTIQLRTLRHAKGEREEKLVTEMTGDVSADLATWRTVTFKRRGDSPAPRVKVANITGNGGSHHYEDYDVLHWEAAVPGGAPWRYLRLAPAPVRTAEFTVLQQGEALTPRDDWHATVLFAPHEKARTTRAWQAAIAIPSRPAPGSTLCVAVNGQHGPDGVFAALRLGGRPIGAARRAVSFPAVPFEVGPRNRDRNYTFYFPITEQMKGRRLEVVLLGQECCRPDIRPEVWTTTYPHPYQAIDLELH